MNIWLTNILVEAVLVTLCRIAISLFLVLVLPWFITLIIIALITRDVLKSLVVGNFLSTYMLQLIRFDSVAADSFLAYRIVGLKFVRIGRISTAVITV